MLRCPNHTTNNALLKPSAQWCDPGWTEDVAVVDANTLSVLTVPPGRTDNEFYLIRFGRNTDEYEPRLLHHFDYRTNVALLSDVGERDVRNLLHAWSDTITFVRLNVTEAAVEVKQTTQSPGGFSGGPSAQVCWPFLSTHTFYGREFVPNGEVPPTNSPLFRFDLKQRNFLEECVQLTLASLCVKSAIDDLVLAFAHDHLSELKAGVLEVAKENGREITKRSRLSREFIAVDPDVVDEFVQVTLS
ncbi:hypothetical protein M3Y99_00706200 [Aphelenchoides fujianensis]|nr:hypothetical protein M3Y99_00706200 [Aphelenchoides fujianensis]